MADRNYKWYSRLSTREQRLVQVMIVLIIFSALYYIVWSPVKHNLNTAQLAYRQQLELLHWVQANESQVNTLPTNAASGADTTPLPTLLTTMAKDNHFSITRLETGADEKMTLTLEHVSFNSLISAMDDLQRSHHVTLLAATISKNDAPGMVNATLQLGK